jgi:hypothetical protein
MNPEPIRWWLPIDSEWCQGDPVYWRDRNGVNRPATVTFVSRDGVQVEVHESATVYAFPGELTRRPV